MLQTLKYTPLGRRITKFGFFLIAMICSNISLLTLATSLQVALSVLIAKILSLGQELQVLKLMFLSIPRHVSSARLASTQVELRLASLVRIQLFLVHYAIIQLIVLLAFRGSI